MFLGAIKSFNVLNVGLRNEFSHVNAPLRADIVDLTAKITEDLGSKRSLSSVQTGILDAIFNLRIKALKWFVNQGNFDYADMLKDVFHFVAGLKEKKEYQILAENLHFALQCNERLKDGFRKDNNSSASDFYSAIKEMPSITYDQFLASISMAVSEEQAQFQLDFMNHSLQIEFVLLAADIIYNDQIKISKSRLVDLEFLVSDSAQEQYALAVQLGIVKFSEDEFTKNEFQLPNEFLTEQLNLAESGLEDYIKRIDEE